MTGLRQTACVDPDLTVVSVIVAADELRCTVRQEEKTGIAEKQKTRSGFPERVFLIWLL